MSCFHVSKITFETFKTTRVLCNQKVYTYQIRKLIDCEYIFSTRKLLLVNKIFKFIFARFFQIKQYFLTTIFFPIEIKKCASTKLKKFFLIENFPEGKTALKFSYDANTLRNITLKYLFYIWCSVESKI